MQQNYLMVNETTNIVENMCVWDGNPNTWTPPPGYLMLAQATTMALIWTWDEAIEDYVLVQTLGVAGIGFTWNGKECVTNEPKPTPYTPPADQPTTSGTQEI